MVDNLQARQKIVDYARTLVGSHYLWGSGGATPGGQDGAKYRPGFVTYHPASTDPRRPYIFAAHCNVQGYYVCAGRYDHIPGGRPARPTDHDLISYLASLDEMTPALWRPFYGHFSPRVIEGKDIDEANWIVWGEDCGRKRHFDCISFVNFVLDATTNTDWSSDIDHYHDTFTSTVDLKDPIVPGDILFRGGLDKKSKMAWHHIAFLCDDGYVVQAQQATKGVHDDEKFAPGLWTARGRLPAYRFGPKPLPLKQGMRV